MEKFSTWTAVAAPFDEANIDTNQLCPTRFNKVPKGPQYASVLFHDLRFDSEGKEKPDFVLNRPAYRKAGIIAADRNFGCGSSRESAVYALAAFGIKSIIAPSFGEIFHSNCMKNGLLPVTLGDRECELIRRQLATNMGAEITVDLPNQVVRDVEGKAHGFEVHALRKRCLLNGLDDISLTEQFSTDVIGFEEAYRREFGWFRNETPHSA